MSRGIIFGVGLFALTLLAFICIPRHLPVTSSATGHPSFSAHIENGHLTLSGAMGSEEAKLATVARAQELAKNLKLRVTDNLEVLEDGGAAAWEPAVPALLTQVATLHQHQATLSVSGQTATIKGAAANGDTKTRLVHEISSLLGTSIHVQDQVTVASAGPASPSSTPTPTPAHASRAQVQAGLDEIVRGEHIAFESNSAVMTPKGRAVVDKLIPALKRSPEAVIEIGGHTDSYGDPDYNLQLSRTRAESVRQYLTDHGVTNRLTAVGYGASRPLSQDRTRAASKKNRRIEFRVKEER
ncbi:MAG: OmpA-like domain-containing protein [Nitrospira sp.]|nr:MAG: OmpA-like domain-containing protein [Nitrospira sp.]